MKRLSRVLVMEGDRLGFWCPGCAALHMLNVFLSVSAPKGPRWTWDGNAEAPTFTPSIRVSGEIACCHTFVRAGQIEFLSDCTHDFAGQTIPLPPIPDNAYCGEPR